MKTHKFVFKDDGFIPNSKFPVIIHRNALSFRFMNISKAADFAVHQASKKWRYEWLWKVYKRPHYHSTTHEALAVISGFAILRIGGHRIGKMFRIRRGDVLVLPAGVAHQAVQRTTDFRVIGFYPLHAMPWDILRGTKKERLKAMANITKIPEPPSFLR